MGDKRDLWIAVDFDGTLTINDNWPDIGTENPYAFDVLKRCRREGHHIILHTCRQGASLKAAINWMSSRGIVPDAVNRNPYAESLYGDPGPKMFADLYIDDRSFGVKKTALGGVDWKYIKRNYKRIMNSL